MHGDIILEAAKALGTNAPEIFTRCAKAHGLRQADVIASDRHLEWQSTGQVPDYVTRWCMREMVMLQQQQAEGHPLFI